MAENIIIECQSDFKKLYHDKKMIGYRVENKQMRPKLIYENIINGHTLYLEHVIVDGFDIGAAISDFTHEIVKAIMRKFEGELTRGTIHRLLVCTTGITDDIVSTGVSLKWYMYFSKESNPEDFPPNINGVNECVPLFYSLIELDKRFMAEFEFDYIQSVVLPNVVSKSLHRSVYCV